MAEKNREQDPIGEEMELQQMSKSRGSSGEDILPSIEIELPRDVSNEDVNPHDIALTVEAVVPHQNPTEIDFMPRDLTLAQSTRPPDAPPDAEQIQCLIQPLDRPVTMSRQRPPSLTGVLDVSDTSLIISPGVVPEDPCTFGECDTVEGGQAIPFDVTQEHPGINEANRVAQAEETERNLDEALRDGDFDLIQENVTPKTLTNCKTNALLKAFQVNKRLKSLVDNAVNPETDEIETLSKSVNEFTCAFINPLRKESDTRSTFKSCLDYLVDKAIDAEQKKFVSHPVVYNLLISRWYRSYASRRKYPWTSPKRWGYLFLNLWPLFDMVLFPILFALFYLIHLIHRVLRRVRDTEICFVVTLTDKDAEDSANVFALIKRTISFLVHKYGYHVSCANYCVILREGERALSNINFEGVHSSDEALRKAIKALQSSSSSPRLYEDLCAVRDAFKGSSVRKNAEKILVLFTNGQLSMLGLGDKQLAPLLNEIKAMDVTVVPVGIGEHPKLSELEQIASSGVSALRFGDYEAPRTVGRAIAHGAEGKDIFDLYLDYFTTPYFIFVRDTLSYLTLLGLHFVICLLPPTLAFSRLEWIVFIFFLGRIAIEVDQFTGARKVTRKVARQRSQKGSDYVVCSPADESQTAITTSKGNGLLKKFSNYFSDRWNTIDFVILAVYVVIFILRMIAWATSDKVADNRLLAVAGYGYGLNAMLLTLRVFGHAMESIRRMGAILIAFFFIMWDVLAIFWQFMAMILAFSLAMTKIYVVEKSFAVNVTANATLACSDEGFVCWWNMARLLAWSCLGMTDREPLNSVDYPSMTLTYLLYSLFLIMGVILLVNMMVALLTHTYERVQNNSLQEWSFKKAITIKSYSISYHPVPVPFNLISLPALALWRLCRCSVTERHRFNEDTLDETEMKLTLDKLVERLEKTYFATYGYSFPLTDERKMDKLLHETDGSRQMANQIVHRVLRQQGCKQDRCIAGASAWNSLGIGIQGCLLTYEGPDSCQVCMGQEAQNQIQIHGAKYLMPFTRETPRIEVLIQESGERRILAVGAVFGSYNCHRMPGWEGGTVGYHVDDGKIFEPGCDELGKEVEDAMAYRGDLIACEVDFDGATSTRFPVKFFLNGREIARASMRRRTGQANPFPFIAMGYQGIRVLAKMCPRDSGVAQASHSPPAQPLARDAGIEKDLANYAQEQYQNLREEMEALELKRRAQAMEFQEELDRQGKMLAEIRELVMLSLREMKNNKSAATNDQFVSAL